MKDQNDIVFSGLGLISAFAKSPEELRKNIDHGIGEQDRPAFQLRDFKAAKFLSNRRLMKNVSHYHGAGMVAVEECKKNANFGETTYEPHRLGLFVGAPPAAVEDHINYVKPIQLAAEADPENIELEFGKTCMNTQGTTLLLGLPNNVLCNGAIILNAKGRNNSYISGEIGAHLSIDTAARNLRKGTVDCAYAGAFSYCDDEALKGMYRQTGHLPVDESKSSLKPGAFQSENLESIFASGAAFVCLESRAKAAERGAPIYGRYAASGLVSFARGPFDDAADQADIMAAGIKNKLQKEAISLADIGVIYFSGSGISNLDRLELNAVEKVFADQSEKPAAACLANITGNLCEAGGVMELASLAGVYESGVINDAISLDGTIAEAVGFGSKLKPEKKYALILKTTLWADAASFLVVESE